MASPLGIRAGTRPRAARPSTTQSPTHGWGTALQSMAPTSLTSRQGTARSQTALQEGTARMGQLHSPLTVCVHPPDHTRPLLLRASHGGTHRPAHPAQPKLPCPISSPHRNSCVNSYRVHKRALHRDVQHPDPRVCQSSLQHPSPRLRVPSVPPSLPLLGAGLGTPFQRRAAICPVLSPPLSSPLCTNSHNSAQLLLMARQGSRRAETQARPEPPLRAPWPAAPWPQHTRAHTRTTAEPPQRDTAPREQ